MIPLSFQASDAEREARYEDAYRSILALLSDEPDWVAAMATVASELHHAFAYYDWTGFYRATSESMLVIGPYQGGHGCLRIDFARGVCGKAASTRLTQVVDDVNAFPDHIACSALTKSEIVVPIVSPSGRLLGVIDVDSNEPAAFHDVDRVNLERIAAELGRRYDATMAL